MNDSDARPGYTGLAKLLHWAILGLLVMQFAIVWAMPPGA